ncbi:adult-specific rigid cuticular protein 12.6 [Parasteatoda tepidariorum]|uniref:adult-specific rigid cuticular protein 12.6 n=1 Tax=Parasteatoda tepidariorum TaxID=114398 RepID=UPI00077FD3E0|nr:adult-specific rigid cuticular protein 12.6 [Parasteatoda tepidariorum]
MIKLALSFSLFALAFAQYRSQNELTTPYPRNYHPPAPVHYVNIGQDLAGDYKFGYDTGKGPLGQSFREETRLPDGTVKGAYGIMDENGRQRIIRYTAGKAGFMAEGDLGPNGAAGVAPGPAPQPAPAYNPPPQQYAAPAPQHYSAPAPQQYAAPAPQQYSAPAPQQYRPAPQAARYNDGQWDPKKDDPYYVEGPSYIDVERLSYNIGTAKQG